MSMPTLKDLINPINKKAVAGIDLRENAATDPLYYQIKDARLAARKAERDLIAGDTQADNPTKHWQTVLTLGQDILSKHSKDLEISCWLTESLLRLYGLPGLTLGFELMNELVSQYWGKIYPLPDEDGISTTVMALSGLNGIGNEGSLIQPIKEILVTQSNNDGCFAFWEYQQAIMVDQIPDKEKRERYYAEGATKLKVIAKAALSTPKSFYTEIYTNINATLDAFNKLTKTCEEKCGQDAPPSSQIKNTLLELQDHLRMLAKDVVGLGDVEIQADTTTSNTKTDSAPKQPNTNKKTNEEITRESALATIEQIAEFFAKTEPHSPIQYLLRRAVRWGNSTLADLLPELISTDTELKKVFALTGITNEPG